MNKRSKTDTNQLSTNACEDAYFLPCLTSQEKQILSQIGITQPLLMTSKQYKLLIRVAKQQQELFVQNVEAKERMSIIKNISANTMLRTEPAKMKCQFCKRPMTTHIELHKLKNVSTEEDKQRLKIEGCLMLFVPCCWLLLLCYWKQRWDSQNSDVAYHQCPNCYNWVAISSEIPTISPQFSTINGSKEEQFAELKVKLSKIRLKGSRKD